MTQSDDKPKVTMHTVTVGEPAEPSPIAVSTITIKMVHFEGGGGKFETFWSGPISGNVAGVAQILREAAVQVDQIGQARSPLFIPGRGPLGLGN